VPSTSKPFEDEVNLVYSEPKESLEDVYHVPSSTKPSEGEFKMAVAENKESIGDVYYVPNTTKPLEDEFKVAHAVTKESLEDVYYVPISSSTSQDEFKLALTEARESLEGAGHMPTTIKQSDSEFTMADTEPKESLEDVYLVPLEDESNMVGMKARQSIKLPGNYMAPDGVISPNVQSCNSEQFSDAEPVPIRRTPENVLLLDKLDNADLSDNDDQYWSEPASRMDDSLTEDVHFTDASTTLPVMLKKPQNRCCRCLDQDVFWDAPKVCPIQLSAQKISNRPGSLN